MYTKLKDFLTILAYGTKLRVIKYPEDEIIFSTDYFTIPYSFPSKYRDAWRNDPIQCIGVIDGIMYIWI